MDTESLFEYMRALASQELNPMIIPPDILKNILHRIETDTKSHARLKLCEDPETNIWSYYRTIKLVHCSSLVVSKHGLYVGGPGSIPTAITTRTAADGDAEHVSLNH